MYVSLWLATIIEALWLLRMGDKSCSSLIVAVENARNALFRASSCAILDLTLDGMPLADEVADDWVRMLLSVEIEEVLCVVLWLGRSISGAGLVQEAGAVSLVVNHPASIDSDEGVVISVS